MAVELECLNFIVPVKTIRKKYPGGWEGCMSDHVGAWYDEYLFRIGAMDPMGIDSLVKHWKSLGFRTHRGGKSPKWLDVCVVDTCSGQPTLPCDWIEVENNSAFLKGKPKGEVFGPGCDTYPDLSIKIRPYWGRNQPSGDINHSQPVVSLKDFLNYKIELNFKNSDGDVVEFQMSRSDLEMFINPYTNEIYSKIYINEELYDVVKYEINLITKSMKFTARTASKRSI